MLRPAGPEASGACGSSVGENAVVSIRRSNESRSRYGFSSAACAVIEKGARLHADSSVLLLDPADKAARTQRGDAWSCWMKPGKLTSPSRPPGPLFAGVVLDLHETITIY